MKNILIFVGAYPPHTSASSNISYNIVEELKKQNYNVTIFTRRNSYYLKKEEIVDGVHIYRINDWNQIIHNKCINSQNKLYKILLYAKRIAFFIPKIFRMQNYSKYYSKKLYKKLDTIVKKNNINIIIPISSPHEEIFTAVNYKNKNKNVKVYPYQLDKFADGERLYATKFLKDKKYRNNIELEKKVLQDADKIFVLPPIYSHYINNVEFREYLDKLEKTEHPLIKNIKLVNKNERESIDILYAGAFYKDLRNPLYLFKLLDNNLIINSKIKVNLYSFGDCQEIVNKYTNKIKYTINNFGKIPHNELVERMQDADILLSIGNNSKDELPSKIFEYLSFCKPIIHLYYSNEDAYLKYLKEYKYSICLKMDEDKLSENTKSFYDFCYQNCNIDIDYGTIENSFKECTPEYVVHQFINQIEG